MSNKKHPKCQMRNLADEAKKRLQENKYRTSGFSVPPKDLTPSQKIMYLKIRDCMEEGREIENPIRQLADDEKMKTLSHEDRQRYILQISADYVSVKRILQEDKKKLRRLN